MAHVKPSGQARTRRRLLTTFAMFGSIVVVTLPAAQQIGWIPASSTHHPAMVHAQLDASHAAAQSGRPATVVTSVSCQRLSNVPGKSITTALVDFPPNAYTPRHRHPGSVTAFVLKGTLNSQMEGGAPGTYAVGQTWLEPPRAVHLFAENPSPTEPAQLLVIFVADDDCGPLTIPD